MKAATDQPRKSRAMITLGTWIVLLLGTIITVTAYGLIRHYEDERIQRDMLRQIDVRHALLRGSLQSYQEALHSLRLLWENSEEISWTEFQQAAEDITSRYSSIQAIQWIPIVAIKDRQKFEAQGRQEIIADFAIRERQPDTNQLHPAGERPYYLPILYNYPLEPNLVATGYDVLTAPTAVTIEKSRQTGRLSLSPKFDLVQSETGVVMVTPVRGTPAPRGDGISGFVQIVFRLNNMLEALWMASPSTSLDIMLVDSTDTTLPPVPLYSHFASGDGQSAGSLAAFASTLTTGSEINIGGRRWTAYYRPSLTWLNQRQDGLAVVTLLSGLVLTILGAAYIRTLAERNRDIAAQVLLRTTELRQTQTMLEEDIASRKEIESKLQETSRQLGSILEQIPGMVYRVSWDEDDTRKVIFVSTGCLALIGYSPREIQLSDFNYLDLVHNEDRGKVTAAIKHALKRQQSFEIEYRLNDRHGDIRWVLDRGTGVYDASGKLLFIEGLIININDLRESEAEKLLLERKLLEGQKLESLGVLAGGIAHDFNNLLTGILGHANLLRRDNMDTGDAALLDRIERSSLRAAELCQQMLAYSGRGRFSVQTVHLDQLTNDLLPLIEASISKQARLTLDFGKPSPAVCVDPTQMRQIIMNLVINASDAIGKESGDILVRTGVVHVTGRQLQACVLSPDLPGGDYAFLEVTDTGCGMDAETQAKIFDPFFTTKFTGRGLGLAAVLGIIRGHEGALQVTSQPGFGSTFRMLLPCAGNPLQGMQNSASTATLPSKNSVSANILLVDDDEQVRLVGEQILLALGHRPVLAADGETALQRFKTAPRDYDLVLLDLTMPGMGGKQVLELMRKITPDIPILIMSGYSHHDAGDKLTEHKGIGFLQKPFTIDALGKLIGELLPKAGRTSDAAPKV